MPARKIDLYPDYTVDDLEHSNQLISAELSALHNQKDYIMSVYEPLKLVQYGPSRLYNLAPTCFVFIPYDLFNEDDILGSDAFTACSAIIVKGEKGIFYAHVPTPSHVVFVREVFEYLRNNWHVKNKFI